MLFQIVIFLCLINIGTVSTEWSDTYQVELDFNIIQEENEI